MEDIELLKFETDIYEALRLGPVAADTSSKFVFSHIFPDKVLTLSLLVLLYNNKH